MLPDTASLEDIQYHIYVRQKIAQGLEDVDAGRVVKHEEVQQRLQALAAIRPLSGESGLRPFGLAKGEFVVPDDFDAPLPPDVLAAFQQ